MDQLVDIEDCVWQRMSCPGCGAWLVVAGGPAGPRWQARTARRIDAFVHRHRHMRQGGAR